jgi:hypothetical protein
MNADQVKVGDLHVTEDGRTVRVTEIRQVDGHRVLYTEAVDRDPGDECVCEDCRETNVRGGQ